MEAHALKEETKSLIDSFDYEQTMQVYSYAKSVGMQNGVSLFSCDRHFQLMSAIMPLPLFL